MALVIAPAVILGILLGMPYGPKGVALGYSIVMTMLCVPLIAWAIRGTGVTAKAYWTSTKRPLFAGLLAIACGLAFKMTLGALLTPILCMILGLGLVVAIYASSLLVIREQRKLYLDLLGNVFQRNL